MLLRDQTLARHARTPSWLGDGCGLPADTLDTLLPFYLPIAEHIERLHAAKGATLTIGIQGPQAAGKTTLTQLLERVLRDVAGLNVAALSIDDIYLTRAQRTDLAARVHPLFITRGVPGTHDVELGVKTLAALAKGGATAVPRFDKGRDDRAPEHVWPVVEGPCDIVLFEGLWIGLSPIDPDELTTPINELEAREDPRAIWRSHANRELREEYPALFAPCEFLIHFQIPDFASSKRWRSGAEHALRARLQASGADTSRVMDDAALGRFFDHYERFITHAMKVMPERANLVLHVDRDHRVVDSSLG